MARQERPSITLNPIVFTGDSPKRKRDNDSDENEFKRPTRHMSDQIGDYINRTQILRLPKWLKRN